MPLPIVTIVGRPNVGKSALLNCLARRRISIVEPTAGVTRDRVSTFITHKDKSFELIDTGGIGIHDVDLLDAEIETQISVAIEKAHVILFVVDIRDGVQALDLTVAELLRHVQKPVILVANKADTLKFDAERAEFYKLGFGEPLPVSAIESRNREDLLDALCAILPAAPEAPEKPVMKLAIVGRRNVGKSTLINTLADEPRMIVSEIPGTTRDSVDVLFEKGGKTFMAIDTAGLVKRGKTKTSIEFYSYCRAQRSIRRADVVLLLLDAPGDISEVDKKVADYIRTEYKPCIVVVNKWDLAKQVDTGKYDAYIRDRLRALPFAPLSFISAQERKNVWATIQLAQDLFEQHNTRVSTAEVNRVIQRAQMMVQTGRRNVRRGHILYGTQIAVAPPSFVLFVNDSTLFDDKYMRYLENRFRTDLPFAEVPVRFKLRGRMRTSHTKPDSAPRH